MQAGHTSSLAPPVNDWPLIGATSDVITGQEARLHGSHRWDSDPAFTKVLTVGGGYLTPPPNTIPAHSTSRIALSLWFKTTVHSGVLASLQSHPLAPGTTRTTGYAPLLYIGLDGRLRGLWPVGQDHHPLASVARVDTGTWQHGVLTAVTTGGRTTQTLLLNGRPVAASKTAALTLPAFGPATNLTFATGYLGGNWPSQPNHGAARPDYFTGQPREDHYQRPRVNAVVERPERTAALTRRRRSSSVSRSSNVRGPTLSLSARKAQQR